MKTLFRLFSLCLALSFLTGCKTLDKGADPVAVRSEQTLSMAFLTFDTFLRLDHQFRAETAEKVPEVHKFAEWLREPIRTDLNAEQKPRGIALIESAHTVLKAYKANRTEENKASVISAIAAVESALAEAQKQLTALK